MMNLLQRLALLMLAATTGLALGACDVTFLMIDAGTDEMFTTITGTKDSPERITTYRPCNVNFEAVVDSQSTNCTIRGAVVMQLRDENDTAILTKYETVAPYALYGNRGRNFNDGSIGGGALSLRARISGVWSDAEYFIADGCCPDCKY